MNNIFSIQRFSMLLNKYHRDHLKTNLLSVALALAIVCVLMGLSAYSHLWGNINTKTQATVFFFFLLMGGLIYTSRMFVELGNKKMAISELLLPVSHFERFLVAWVSSYLIFPLVFTACFFAVDWLVLNISNSLSGADDHLFNLFEKDTKLFTLMMFYSMLHALAFLGSLFFNKMHLVKTGLAMFIFCIFLFLVNKPIISLIFKEDAMISVPFVVVNLQTGGSVVAVSNNGNGPKELVARDMEYMYLGIHSLQVVKYMIFTVVFLLWVTAYFKLKEKQV